MQGFCCLFVLGCEHGSGGFIQLRQTMKVGGLTVLQVARVRSLNSAEVISEFFFF